MKRLWCRVFHYRSWVLGARGYFHGVEKWGLWCAKCAACPVNVERWRPA